MKKKLIAFAVSLLAVATIGVVGVRAVDAAGKSARECDSFAIIRCGTKGPAELRVEYDTRNGSKSNGTTVKQNDIPKIFSAFGISRGELNGTFKNGEVRRNGNVVVGGKVVATGAKVGIRNVGSGTAIAGTNAKKAPASAMAHDHAVMVKFNDNGKFAFAVMDSCGNPVQANPVKNPSASCEGIVTSQLSRNSFNFVGKASTKDGAKIESYRFTATDASGRVVGTRTINSSNLSADSGKFEFANPGRYTVRLHVNSTAGDNLTSDHCVTTVDVAPELKPGVSIDKTVNDKESASVNLNEEFTYKLVVKNTGNTDLKDVVVSDKQPANIKFISASEGKIGDAGWAHVIPELKVGASAVFTIKAKVVAYQAGDIKNTACVDAPSVPGGPDDCDDAFVKVPEPIATCDSLRVTYLNRNDFTLSGKSSVFNGATVSSYVFTVASKTVAVSTNSTSATTDKLTITEPGTYDAKLVVRTSVGDKTSDACVAKVEIAKPDMVQVCDPSTGKVISVPKEEADNYKPVNDPACQPPVVENIKVCELKTKEIIVINKKDFNSSLHSTDLSKCASVEIKVCDPNTGEIITVIEENAGNYKPANDPACKATVRPEEPAGKGTPEQLVNTGAGDALGMATAVTIAGALSHRMILGRRK